MQKLPISQSELRKFGFVLAGGLLVLFALFPLLLSKQVKIWPFLTSGLFILVTQYKSSWLQALYHPWMKIGHVLGWVNTRLILGFIFFVLITPFGVVRRIAGKDTLQRTYDPKKASYRQISTQHSPKQMEKPY